MNNYNKSSLKFHLFIFYFLLAQMQFAINHSTANQNLLWLVSSVYILFFIGTDAVRH